MPAHRILLLVLICSLFKGCNNELELADLQLQQVFVGSVEIDLTTTISEDLPTDRNISLVFSNAVDVASATSAISLRSASQTVAINLSFLSQDKNVLISPIGTLENNTLYTLIISNLLKGANGQSFETREINFKTALGGLTILSVQIDEVDVTGEPSVVNAPLDFEIEFEFSSPLDQGSFEQAIELFGPQAPLLQVSYANNDQTAIITGNSPLSYLSKYELELTDALNGAEGEDFSGYSLTFYTELDSTFKFPEITEEELLTKIQAQTFQYFWDFGHPVSGLIRERNTSGETVTTGGSGFGLMTIIVGIERGFITRAEGLARFDKIVSFLGSQADRFHGVWPHWLNGTTGKVIPFSPDDDGGDLVETAFMVQGLLTVRQYLDGNIPEEALVIDKINELWQAVEWDWYTQDGQNVLYWHWSPNFGWQKNLQISGYNEALIVYILASSSTTFSIGPEVYNEGWARNGTIANGNQYLGIDLPLGPDYGGPMFFAHYSFLGLDPRNLSDQYAHYWQQNLSHATINREWCALNPGNYISYSGTCWGLTASDDHQGYAAHSPTNDLGVITPTAAIASLPYTPEFSIEAIKHFYYQLGDRLWGDYGFYDAFNFNENWVADSYLAIDQGPIIIMIENHRTGLLWELFMSAPEVHNGLDRLGFNY